VVAELPRLAKRILIESLLKSPRSPHKHLIESFIVNKVTLKKLFLVSTCQNCQMTEKKGGRRVKDHVPLPLMVGKPSHWKWMQRNIPGLDFTVRTLSSLAQLPWVQSIAHQLCIIPLPSSTSPPLRRHGKRKGAGNTSLHSSSISNETAELFYGKIEAELIGTSKVYVKEKKHQDRCWKGGSFGKGTLSRGEANWYARQLEALKQARLEREEQLKSSNSEALSPTNVNDDGALSTLPSSDPERYVLMPEETLFLIYSIGSLNVLKHDVSEVGY
jgi:hypothetical protein